MRTPRARIQDIQETDAHLKILKNPDKSPDQHFGVSVAIFVTPEARRENGEEDCRP